jgi:hypothetical protein
VSHDVARGAMSASQGTTDYIMDFQILAGMILPILSTFVDGKTKRNEIAEPANGGAGVLNQLGSQKLEPLHPFPLGLRIDKERPVSAQSPAPSR